MGSWSQWGHLLDTLSQSQPENFWVVDNLLLDEGLAHVLDLTVHLVIFYLGLVGTGDHCKTFSLLVVSY